MGMIPQIEEIYPEKSDITIMNTFYQYPVFNEGKKVCDDFIDIVYKDNSTGKKSHKIIWKPDYIYYLLNDDEEVPDYNKLFIERDKVHPVYTPFRDLEKSIAEQTKHEDFYYTNLKNHDRSNNKKLHTDRRVFFSDSDIENHYRFRFANTYTNNINPLRKGFFDIEVDGKFAAGDFVEMGECEINCVTYLDQANKDVYTFILRNQDNPLIQEFENEIINNKFGYKEIKSFVTDAVGGINQAEKYDTLDFKYNLQFYDKEIELIQDLFSTIHRTSPDFVLGWNSSSFDLQYIISRCFQLGYDPADILCDKNYEVKVVKNYIDHRNENDTPERGDYTYISGLPVFIDQMIQYASRRKAKFGSMTSLKLDDIGLKEANVRKLDYHHITNSVTELPWLDFKTFVLYNIMDVVVQQCIEKQTQDLEYLFAKCIVNNTVYKKGHRQSVYLINRFAAEWYKQGYIIGNNCNRWNEKPPKFLGAIVGSAVLTNDYSKLKINGRAIWVCDNLIDFDYKSLYPSIMLEFNIAPNTQIGKIIIDHMVYKHENAFSVEETKYSRGGEFLDNFVCDNIIEFSSRWLHLGGIEDVINDIDEYYNRFNIGSYQNMYYSNSAILPTLNGNTSDILNKDKVTKPITFFDKFNRDKNMTYDNIRKGLLVS